MGILSSHSPLRTAATGFLQSCVFSESVFNRAKMHDSEFLFLLKRLSHGRQPCVHTPLRSGGRCPSRAFGSVHPGGRRHGNTAGPSDLGPAGSSRPSLTCLSPLRLSPLHRCCLLCFWSLLSFFFLSFFLPPLSAFLSQMEARQCQKLPSPAAACLKRQVTTKVKRLVGRFSAREIEFALP